MTAARKLDPPQMTVEEFFTWDGGGHVGKLELVNGVVRARPLKTADQSVIQGNIGAGLHLAAKARGERVMFSGPVQPPLRAELNVRAPDVVVTASPPSTSRIAKDPILIVEILSPSNEAATWETIGTLAALASMREILVVQSTAVEARVFTRDAAGGWPNEPVVSTAGGTVRLTALGLDLPVADIYEGTLLEADARGG